MDLNHQYFEHQLVSMRVMAASDSQNRVRHQARADKIGRLIEGFQHGIGAPAATSWALLRLAGEAQTTKVQP